MEYLQEMLLLPLRSLTDHMHNPICLRLGAISVIMQIRYVEYAV
jgi:hypothetical protein